MVEETKIDDDRRIKFLTEKIRNKKVLDFGCGNGGFLLKANGLTNEAVGIEPEIQFKSFFKKIISKSLIHYVNYPQISLI